MTNTHNRGQFLSLVFDHDLGMYILSQIALFCLFEQKKKPRLSTENQGFTSFCIIC